MRYYEEQQFQMLGRVFWLLKKHYEKLASKAPALHDVIADFIERKKTLDKLKNSGLNAVMVSSGEKKSIKDGLAEAMSALSDMLYTLHYGKGRKETGTEGDNNKEKAYFEYSFSELRRMSSPKLCLVSEQLIDASKKVKRLHLFGLTEGDIREAEAYYKEFTKAKDKPTQSKKAVAGRNRSLSEGIKKCIELLDNHMDRLVRLATRDDKQLRSDYFNCRIVIGKISGRPSDKERRFRRSRHKKIDSRQAVKRYVRACRKCKILVTEAILFGTYAKKQAYSDSELEVALIVDGHDVGSLANSELVAIINRKFPKIFARFYSSKSFERDDAFINQIKRTGVKVDIA